jgi:TonB dependent receptor
MAIFRTHRGECPSDRRLRELYASAEADQSVACELLGHIVSCAHRLDRVNRLLGLPLLAERYPTDTLGPDQGSKGGPGASGGAPAGGRQLMRRCMRQGMSRFQETFEHRPKELRIAVNGYFRATQKISAELSEQELNLDAGEKLSFIEIFSEQGCQLMQFKVEAPPEGAFEQQKRVQLSDGRALEASLDLSSAGTYTIKAEHEGFATVEIRGVVLNVNDQRDLKIQLKVATVGDTVTVVDSAPSIKTDAAVSTVVDRQFVENLPLNGRSFQSLITLAPGVVQTIASSSTPGQFSVNGHRSNANYFTVDGISANIGVTLTSVPGQGEAGSLPTFSALGGTNNLISIDALQEFKLLTSGYAPEFGRSPGGQVSLTTRSGTNQYRGTLFQYIRNDIFDAADFFVNAGPGQQKKPPLRQNNFGGVLGGPIWLPQDVFGPLGYDGRNRTFFFFSYEGLRLRQPQTMTGREVPSMSLRQAALPLLQPFLNAFPQPNGPETGTGLALYSVSYSNPSTLDASSIRIDHFIKDRLRLFGRYNYAPSETVTRSVGNLSQLSETTNRTQTLTLGGTSFINPRTSNELLFNYSHTEGHLNFSLDDFGMSAPPPDSLLFPPFTSPEKGQFFFQLNFGLRPVYRVGRLVENIQRQINIVDSLSHSTGSHQLKFGVDYRRLTPVFGPQEYLQGLVFANQDAVKAGIISNYSINASAGARPIFTNFSAFAQDTWRLSPRVTLTYGLRWELNPPPSVADGNYPVTVTGFDNPVTLALAPRGTPLWKTSYNNFAPRFGLAYRLLQSAGWEMVLRGGGGVFYDLGNGQAASVFTDFPFVVRAPYSNIRYPVTPEQLTPPPFPDPSNHTAKINLVSIFDPDLKLPRTYNWNLTLEQALGQNQTVSASYVASIGRQLLRGRALRNPNPSFDQIQVTDNGSSSDYHSLQLQFQRRLSRGFQTLVNYTWSHAIDDVSADAFLTDRLRGNAEFDIRHNFSTAITYEIPGVHSGAGTGFLLRDWAVDSIVRAQSAPPFSIIAGSITNPDFSTTAIRPNLNYGQPVYINDSTVPGGRRVNKSAFSTLPNNQQGNLGRNVLRGFPFYQVDFALRRQFNLTEQVNVQFRAEAFNLFNHPNFGLPNNNLTSLTFGQATRSLGQSLGGLNSVYQIGGARSLQFAVKLQF